MCPQMMPAFVLMSIKVARIVSFLSSASQDGKTSYNRFMEQFAIVVNYGVRFEWWVFEYGLRWAL